MNTINHIENKCLDAKTFICYQHNFNTLKDISFYYWDKQSSLNEAHDNCVAKFTLKLKNNIFALPILV